MRWIRTTTTGLLLSGAALLAYEPLIWLLGSWYLPGYPKSGPVVFALVVLSFGYSLSSQPLHGVDRSKRSSSIGFSLLLVSACVRAAAQVADIDMLGALVLAVDVYALALLLGTGVRARAVAPLWLAVLFCFCLPLEPWLQRLLGTGLQWLSAQGACGLLVLVADDVVCNNLRLSVHGVEVLVDLACSGSRLLIQASLLLTLLFAYARPNWRQVGVGVLLTLIGVWLLNAFRIALIALGLAYKPWGLDVMAPEVHAGIGLFCFAVLALILLCWMRRDHQHMGAATPPALRPDPDVLADGLVQVPVQLQQVCTNSWKGLLGALGFVALVLVIVQLESKPLDRTAPLATPYVPAVLAGYSRRAAAITEQERNYYQTYGGAAAKASYGANGLLLVRTGAPIRHLHAPDVCLGGMGFQVDFIGTDSSAVPTAVYRAQRSTSGEAWQVRVSYVADNGVVTASLSELAWLWILAPSTRWTMVQRLVPWPPEKVALPGHPQARLVPERAAAWETSVLRAFNLFSPVAPAIQPNLATPVAPTTSSRKLL